MEEEQKTEGDRKHGRHQCQEQNMQFNTAIKQFAQPQLDEGWCNGCADKQAIQQRVEQEEHEELIVGESDTVIQPKHKEENTCYCLNDNVIFTFNHDTSKHIKRYYVNVHFTS